MPGRIPAEAKERLRALLAEQPSPYYRDLVQAIGKNVDRRTIKKWCANLGLPYKPITGSRSKRTPEMEKRLRTVLAEQPSISRKKLVAAMGNLVCSGTIIDWCKELGLPYRPRSRKESRKLTPEIEKRLRLLVAEKPEGSYLELARELRVSSQSVRRWVIRLGLPHHDNKR
jgi:transposase